MADFVVLHKDPREDIHHSTAIDFVVRNGAHHGAPLPHTP